MVTRLEIGAPELARIASEAPRAMRSRAALAVVGALAFHFAEITQQLISLIASADSQAAAALADRLDDQYFALDAERDDKAARTFAQARAAMAVKFSLEGKVDEALYEAIMAIDDGEYVEAVFKRALLDEV